MTTLRLKATKTSLYKLVSEYADLPPMNQTDFRKAHRCRSYWLHWGDCTAYFSTCGGGPYLSIDYGVIRRMHKLTVADLRSRGMIEEVPND